MEKAVGTVKTVKKLWWIKVNTKPVRRHYADGAVFPHSITAEYRIGQNIYTRKKLLWIDKAVPAVGDSVEIAYDPQKPQKGKILL